MPVFVRLMLGGTAEIYSAYDRWLTIPIVHALFAHCPQLPSLHLHWRSQVREH